MTNKVYVELDALLDTRLATVSSLDEEAAVRLLMSEAYYTRRSDDFSAITGIDHERYLEAYAARNVQTLRNSIRTDVPEMLAELIGRLEVQEDDTPVATEFTELEVNIWPYVDLSSEEREELMLVIMCFAGIQTLPKIVCFDPKELRPATIKKDYSGLILYNLRDWLTHHLEDFGKHYCPEVAVLAPALYNAEIVETEELAEVAGLQSEMKDFRTDLSMFHLTEVACAQLFQLNYVDVKYFSISRKDR